MLKNLTILIRYFLFWILFFFLERLIFLLSFSNKLQSISLLETTKSFIVGLWMDASMAAYISVLPLLVTLIVWFFPPIKIPATVLKWYTLILVVAFLIICIFNFNIYREWGSKINFKALDYGFNSPNEAIASGASSPVLASLVTLAALILISFWLSKKIICYNRLKSVHILAKSAVSIIVIGLTFLAIRGGRQLSPMNESMAYYSNKPILNHAAINTEWGLMRDILNNRSNKNPYNYYSKKEASEIKNELFKQPKTPSTQIVTAARPNVVVIILESFTADVVESLGGDKGVAPQMERLAAEGVLFENIYASGDRTDKGIVAVLNAFPSQAIRSIMKVNNKQDKLPSFSDTFSKAGYHTAFFYGGETEFFNMKSYLLSHHYDKIIQKKDFDKRHMNSKWGAYDDLVYQKLLSESSQTKQPFFASLLTLTNHEPFEVPGKPRFAGAGIENKFRSTAYFADSCLGSFINNARRTSWYKNTLFVVVADHGHRLPRNESDIFHPDRFRIPLLFFGEVIRPDYRGKRISKIGSQTDIIATVLTQLKIPAQEFRWSRDLLNPGTPEFAFFDWDNGFGVVNQTQIISFDNTGKQVIFKKTDLSPGDDNLLRWGKAYMQQVYQEYLDY
ncbi:MAG TPA: LTA synthase family protein [Pedobacter sp.]|jgi:phosphoglycerol transferase MdoB-like AlkP superfamily enzyme